MSASSRRAVRRLSKHVARLGLQLSILSEMTVATLADLNAKVEELNAAILADEQQDDDNAKALEQTIADLKAQIAAGGTDFQPVIDRLTAIQGNLHAPPTA